MTILGVDPGIGRVGWAIVAETGGKVKEQAYGCLETDSKLPEEERLNLIHKFFLDLISKTQPDAMAVEQLFFATNVKTAFSVGQARGVIVLCAAEMGLQLTSYTPLQVKSAVSGYGNADKRQVQLMVKALLGLKTIPKPDDAADALAIALTHAFSYKLQKKGRV